MNYKIKAILVAVIGMLCLNMFCMNKPQLAIAQTNLDVLQNKYGRTLVNRDANKVVATIARGDTFLILGHNQDAQTDFFMYYKVKTRDNKRGFLFENDLFDVIEAY